MVQPLKINNFMKSIFSLFFISIFFFNSCCAQKKIEKPPKPNSLKLKDIKLTELQKPTFVLTLGKLKQNKDSLYCWEVDGECSIIDGKIRLYTHSIASGDNASVTERLYAEGEFLEGKYQGIWKYYDKDGSVIKKENWDNGNLKFRKQNNRINTCDNMKEYKFSTIQSSGYNSIEQFKKDFSIKSGKLTCKNGIIKSMRLIFENETTIQFVSINDGITTGHEIQIKEDPIPSGKSYFYDKNGNIERISDVKEELSAENGYYLDYYYPQHKENTGVRTIPIIKSEGQIKNNFKIGEWKYYDIEGKLKQTKTYSIKDYVDVRFPHCIFNKIEPCY